MEIHVQCPGRDQPSNSGELPGLRRPESNAHAGRHGRSGASEHHAAAMGRVRFGWQDDCVRDAKRREHGGGASNGISRDRRASGWRSCIRSWRRSSSGVEGASRRRGLVRWDTCRLTGPPIRECVNVGRSNPVVPLWPSRRSGSRHAAHGLQRAGLRRVDGSDSSTAPFGDAASGRRMDFVQNPA